MFRSLLAILIIFGFMSIGMSIIDSQAPTAQVAGNSLYLPLIFTTSLTNDVIQLNITTLENCPTHDCVYNAVLGTLENAGSQPYIVALEASAMIYPYPADGTPYPPVSETLPITPALEAVLPGQTNPFSLEYLCYKSCTVVNRVYISSVRPMAVSSYEPLTILDWDFTDPMLSGVVKNDSNQTVYNARVVAANPERCPLHMASLEKTTLAPSEQTGYTIFPLSSYCIDERLLIVGQGSTSKP